MMPSAAASLRLVLPAIAAAGWAADLRTLCAGAPHSHVETVSAASHSYTIRMGGAIDGEMTRDPVGYWAFDQYWEPNISVRLENMGDTPVVNPWLQTGPVDTRTLRSIVDSVVNPTMSESERARRLWEFEIRNRFHATTSDDEVKDAVKRFNAYGYTLCGDESHVMSDLWRAAGLRVRRGYPNGHSTAEVYYDGGWHLLDSDESIICLLRDNHTIASEAQIVADHDLMKRTHTYGPLHDDNRLSDETSAALHYYEGERGGEHPSHTRHSMNFTLRPGEAITWAWNLGSRFHAMPFENKNFTDANRRWRLPAQVMNGELAWSPDFTREATLKYVQIRGAEYRRDGAYGPGIYAAGSGAAVELPFDSPYPIVGGRLTLDFRRRDVNRDQVKVSLSFDAGKSWRALYSSTHSDYSRLYLDFDNAFPLGEPARYSYLLRFELAGAGEPPLISVKGAAVQSKLQMARLALPGLRLGDNRFTYSDQSGGARRVRITHLWNECDSAATPGAPSAALYPPDGGQADGTRITFRWQPPQGGSAPADYQFQLSEHADMRWPLSPNFHKLISRTASRGTATYQLPYLGLLNPGETYYWRVRARTAEGVWGPWSKVFSFSAAAPAVPTGIGARFDPASRSATLEWQSGRGGTAPVRYRIYGSAERGFTASATPYRYHAGSAGIKDAPPNLLLETPAGRTRIDLPPELWRPYYRVSAIDAEGRESGPSDLAELPYPLIVSRKLPDGRAGMYYQAALEVSASIGHLTSQTTTRPYDMAFRDGAALAFELSGAPAGLAIDSKTGMLAGFLPAAAAGSWTLEVRVRDQRKGGQDTVRLPLRVSPATPPPAPRPPR